MMEGRERTTKATDKKALFVDYPPCAAHARHFTNIVLFNPQNYTVR